MSPEALERLRWKLVKAESEDSVCVCEVRVEDFRALLAERDELRAQVDAARETAAELSRVSARAAEMEKALDGDGASSLRYAGYAEGVAAERARVVAWLRACGMADDLTLRPIANRLERGEHDKEGA